MMKGCAIDPGLGIGGAGEPPPPIKGGGFNLLLVNVQSTKKVS